MKIAAVIFRFLLKLLPLKQSNVYRYLRQHYRASISKLYGEFVRLHVKMNKLKHHLRFIRNCKREKLIPTFARIRLANRNLRSNKVIWQCSMKILQAEMKYKKRELSRCFRFRTRLAENLKNNISSIVYVRLQSILHQIVKKSNDKVEQRHTKKLNHLRQSQTKIPTKNSKLNPVTNLSKRTLTDEEHQALVHGLHHVYPPEKFDVPQFVCNIEYFYSRLLEVQSKERHYERKDPNVKVLHQLSSTQLDAASKLRSIANGFQRTAQSELEQLGKYHRQTRQVLRTLAKDRSVIITKPDKGRGVVLMDRDQYLEKMYEIISDQSTFKQVNIDTTLTTEDRLRRTLIRLKEEKFISEQEYNLARPIGVRPARLYGLPKLHKPGTPLRPVMSATKTVGYGLGKILTQRLTTLRHSPFVVKDTFDFVNKIKKSTNADKRMVSFDVKSLFTNVPLTYTIELILDQLYPKCSSMKNVVTSKKCRCQCCRRRSDFHTLLCAATSDIQFIFDGKTYVQHNGVAMGAPLAPIIADIFMAHLETTLMNNLEQAGVCEWHRYVDNTFVLLRPDTNIDDVLNILNGFHPSIKFTHEVEKDGTIAFLDVKVIRSQVAQTMKTGESQSTPIFIFDTTIHRKETFTGLMTNWHSFVPHSYKKASVVSMIQRALSICSTYTLLANEFDEIRRISQLNNYPISFVDTCIGIGLTKHRNKFNNNNNMNLPMIGPEKRRMFVEIPYVGNKTETLKKQINRLTSNIRPDLDIRFVAKPPHSVQTYFPVKDPVPTHLKSDIVYSVKCADCGETYVGKTERQCARRMFEHGAPKDFFGKQPNTDDDDDNNSNTNVPRTQTTTRTNNRVEQIEDRNPPVRRSSRIRNKQSKVGITPSNPTSDRKIEQSTEFERKKEKTDTAIVSISSSSLTEHAKTTGHHIDWAQVRILWGDHVPHRLLVKESLIIQAHQPRLNRTTHSVPLLIYPEGIDRNLIPNPHL